MQPLVAAGLPPPKANKSPCSRTVEAGDFSSSKREMVGKDHVSCWKAAGRSGANPARPAGVGPGIGPDYGEARGLNHPGGGGAPGRGNGGGGGGGNQKGSGGSAKAGGGGGGGDDDAVSMRGRCFRCGKKGHQVADCTESKPVRRETCNGYGHDKSKCPTEGVMLVVLVPAGGASANATALDVAEEALVVGGISGECYKVVGRGGVEQARRGKFVADTGDTTHMFANSDGFVRYEECDRRVRVAAGETFFPIVGVWRRDGNP
ncbi:unnamed protein product [Ectocarpus sp. CCAP 1310/34]|nr:unnamed protein product [Ectocarpus sp. CCAP 1310/34]